jgi:hypothetical protein
VLLRIEWIYDLRTDNAKGERTPTAMELANRLTQGVDMITQRRTLAFALTLYASIVSTAQEPTQLDHLESNLIGKWIVDAEATNRLPNAEPAYGDSVKKLNIHLEFKRDGSYCIVSNDPVNSPFLGKWQITERARAKNELTLLIDSDDADSSRSATVTSNCVVLSGLTHNDGHHLVFRRKRKKANQGQK